MGQVFPYQTEGIVVENLDWLYNLKSEVLYFLELQRSKEVQGYYNYSKSGDLYDSSTHWNIGSSVFALKIYYTLGVEKNKEIIQAANYIKSFYHSNGQIYDDLVFKKSFLRNIASSLKHNNLANIFNEQYKRAETRQAYSSLMLYDELPDTISLNILKSTDQIDSYLSRLNWHQPWGAGSHFSHLMFFYKLANHCSLISSNDFSNLTSHAIEWVNKLQHAENGGWYIGDQTDRFIINGAMKVITGLIAVNQTDFKYAEKLIDTCLRATNDEHACDNFNIILVLNYASKLMGRNYRQKEITEFAMTRLLKYYAHYKKNQGGFSFFPYQANQIYYGTKISQGLNEADIHGTVLFLWGIAIASQILGLEKEIGFREFLT